jgi:hypothetical protein
MLFIHLKVVRESLTTFKLGSDFLFSKNFRERKLTPFRSRKFFENENKNEIFENEKSLPSSHI